MIPTPDEEIRRSLLQAGRKRQRQGSKTSESGGDGTAAGAPTLEKGERQPSLRLSLLRRPGSLQRAASNVEESETVKFISRETIFMEKLPLKAPYIDQDICGDCGKIECECEPESDSEEEAEETPLTCPEKCLGIIRAKTDIVRDYSGRIVNDQGFQIFIVILILINSLLIGVSTFDFVEDDPAVGSAFRMLDFAFLIVFTIELVMQFLYHGYNLFLDGWLVFDLWIVIMSWGLESISVLRALRLRSFRIFRVFRLTSRIRALRRLVEVSALCK